MGVMVGIDRCQCARRGQKNGHNEKKPKKRISAMMG